MKTVIDKSIEMLGKKGKDKITGSEGIITSVSFDLYGCVTVIINPSKIDKDGKEVPSIGWIDINRVDIIKDNYVMPHPNFERKYKETDEIGGCDLNKPAR